MNNHSNEVTPVAEPKEQETTNAAETAVQEISEEEQVIELTAAHIAHFKMEQALIPGIVAGLAVGLIGAVVWAAITVATGYQIGYMALAIGAAVGIAIRAMGKGVDMIFGICGGAIALISVVLGNAFSIIGFVANEQDWGYFETLTMVDPLLLSELMAETFSGMDLLFYGIAVYEGYKFAFRQVTAEEVAALDNKNGKI